MPWYLFKFFEKKFFGPKKIFWTPPREKIGKKSSKMAKKWQFWGRKGHVMCSLQFQIAFFYCRMMKSARKMKFWRSKIGFCRNWGYFKPKKSKKVAFFVSYKLNLVILGGSIPHVFHMFYGRLLAQVIALMRVYWCIKNFHHKLKRLGELAGRNNVGIVKMPILDHFGRFFAIWVPYGF